MSVFDSFLATIIQTAAANADINDCDYEQDGIRYCGNCHTPKQCVLDWQGKKLLVDCLCKCGCEAEQRRADMAAEEQHRHFIKTLRTNGITDAALRNVSFADDNGSNAEMMANARKYVDSFARMKKDNIGLLLWGNTGTGKTFTAACIANALIDKGVSVLMTSFPMILNAMQCLHGDERLNYLAEFNHYDLLIIDDLGAERTSEYALEIVYSVIEQRYKARRPLIITTNLGKKDFTEAPNMNYQRIYDRVLSMCVPVHFGGENQRKKVAAKKMRMIADLWG